MNEFDFTCEVDFCLRIASGRDRYCGAHSSLNRRYGDPVPIFRCNGCSSEYSFKGKDFGDSSWYCNNCHDIYKKLRRAFHLHRITFGNYLELYAAQGGSCKLCKYSPEDLRDLHIDHDHNCCPKTTPGGMHSCGNCIRGLVCKNCNMMLGFYESSRGTLTLDVFDKYLAEPHFIFTSSLTTGELVDTKRYRDPRKVKKQ